MRKFNIMQNFIHLKIKYKIRNIHKYSKPINNLKVQKEEIKTLTDPITLITFAHIQRNILCSKHKVTL